MHGFGRRTWYDGRMKRIALILPALPLLLPSPARAQSAVDERAIITAVNALDAAVDDKDWKAVRDLLLDEVSIALPNEEPATVPADELVERWRASLHEDKTSFHLRGGERVTFDGADSAVLRSRAHLWQRLPGIAGDDRYERWADYHHELDRTDDGNWRVRHLGYVTRLEQGNLAVLAHRLPAPPAPDETPPSAADDAGDDPEPDNGTAEPDEADAPDESAESPAESPGEDAAGKDGAGDSGAAGEDSAPADAD